MKWMLCLFLALSSYACCDEITKAEDLTYDCLIELASNTGYTDHIPHFKKLFENQKVKTFLEFGVGFSTKYFLDSCEKVISVEFVSPGSGPEWMKKCLLLYRDYSNWIPIVFYCSLPSHQFDWAPYKYAGSEWVSNACSYQNATHKNYALIDDFYLKDLEHFISNTLQGHTVDAAFVDPGIYIRGDLVQLLFGKVPVILAHDTNVRAFGIKDDVYGYSRIVTPDTYEEMHLPGGQGTTIWILKDDKYHSLIQEMVKYANELAHAQPGGV